MKTDETLPRNPVLAKFFRIAKVQVKAEKWVIFEFISHFIPITKSKIIIVTLPTYMILFIKIIWKTVKARRS
jgi:hypothetical protein